jgi:uncharacterized protein YuzE
MTLILDTQACALYVRIKEGKVSKTREAMPEVFVDYNASGQVLGIDLASPCVATLRKLAKQLHLPILNRIRALPKVA